MAIIKDKIFFKFGIEDEDIFYLLDIHRRKAVYNSSNKAYNERMEIRDFFLREAIANWEDFWSFFTSMIDQEDVINILITLASSDS